MLKLSIFSVFLFGLLTPFQIQAQVDPGLNSRLQSQGAIIVDRTSLALFDQIPETYLQRAANIRMMWGDRSVGGNISNGLDCLTYPSNVVAITSCKRQHTNPDFPTPDWWVTWNRNGGYPRSNWIFYFDPGVGAQPELSCSGSNGMWDGNIGCFIQHVRSNSSLFEVFSYQHSYLAIDETSSIASPTNGYFVNRPNAFDIYDYQQLETEFPTKIFFYWTTSLARSSGTRVGESYNQQMRQFVINNKKILFDVADIESHDPNGGKCYDNRDGVSYCTSPTSTNCENLPDDGQDITAICQHYTTEPLGGHLQDRMKVMMGKMYWVLMAQIAGWQPSNPPPPLSPSPTQPSTPNTDLDGDNDTDFFDLLRLILLFMQSGNADINQDGKVDIYDFNIIVRNM